MLLQNLLPTLETIAPLHLAESWDNVGVLVGDVTQQVTRGLLCIDYTAAVADEAKRAGCDLVVAYHPPLFQPLKRLRADSLLADALLRRVVLYSPHTALDVAAGGTNDVLADVVGLGSRRALRPVTQQDSHVKLVVFVPTAAVETVSTALFTTGAGVLGAYRDCSFRSAGTGTFFGNDQASPAVGQAGRAEQVDEVRVEMVVALQNVAAAVQALRAAHPYEEPGFDLIRLAPEPSGQGLGRIGSLPSVPRNELVARIKTGLGLSHVLVAGPLEGTVGCAAVGAGACGTLLDDAIAGGAELYLTGELRHHDALKAAHAGLTVVCTLHSNSERAVLRRLQERLAKEAPEVPFLLSSEDRDPFTIW